MDKKVPGTFGRFALPGGCFMFIVVFMLAMRVLATIATMAALYFASSVFIPLTLGICLFFLLDPLINWLQAKKVPRTGSSITLVIASIVITGFFVSFLYGAFADIAREIPAYSKKVSTLLSSIQAKTESIRKDTSTVVPQSTGPDKVQKVQIVGNDMGSVTGFALHGLGTLFDLLAAAFFVPFIALFLLLEKEGLGNAGKRLFKTQDQAHTAVAELDKMIKGFFLGNFIIGIIMSIMLVILYSVLGLKNSVSLGVITGFLNLIPLLGPLISLFLPLAAALLQFNSAAPFIIISSTIIFLHFFTANIIVPKFVGSHVNVNATASTLSLLFWGFLWGPVGLLLAVPLTAMIRIFLEVDPGLAKLASFIREKPHTPEISVAQD